MAKCSKCSRTLNSQDYQILCCKCKIWQCCKCTSLSNKEIKNYPSDKNYTCKNCSNVRRSVQISNNNSTASTSNSINNNAQSLSQSEEEQDDKELSLIDVVAILRDLGAKIESIQEENRNLVRMLEKRDNELEECERKIENLEHKIDKLEQKDKAFNVVIKNVPRSTNENCSDIVHKISELIGFNCENSANNYVAHRISKKQYSPILVRFKNMAMKDEMMEKIKNKKEITLDELEFTDYNEDYGKVYVNHDLTAFRRELFMKAKAKQKQLKYKFLWISNGDILMRKTNDSNKIFIRSFEDIANLG